MDATPSAPQANPASLAVLLLPGFSAIAFLAAIEPLRIANRLTGRALYRWTLHGPAMGASGGHVAASNGLQIRLDGPLPARPDTLLVCAGFDPLAEAHPRLIAAVRRIWAHGARLGAIDTGAFLLAAAGVLDATPITLHWEALAEFRQRFPRIPVTGELYERHARLFTCAGGTAALDLMLAELARDHGEALARATSDQLILDRIRPPDDPQRRAPSAPATPLIAAAEALMRRHLATPLPLDQLASQCRCSRRQLERAFSQHLGLAPAAHYRRLRLDHALRLIREHGASQHEAALAAGFSSQPVLARACRRELGLTVRAANQAAAKSSVSMVGSIAPA